MATSHNTSLSTWTTLPNPISRPWSTAKSHSTPFQMATTSGSSLSNTNMSGYASRSRSSIKIIDDVTSLSSDTPSLTSQCACADLNPTIPMAHTSKSTHSAAQSAHPTVTVTVMAGMKSSVSVIATDPTIIFTQPTTTTTSSPFISRTGASSVSAFALSVSPAFSAIPAPTPTPTPAVSTTTSKFSFSFDSSRISGPAAAGAVTSIDSLTSSVSPTSLATPESTSTPLATSESTESTSTSESNFTPLPTSESTAAVSTSAPTSSSSQRSESMKIARPAMGTIASIVVIIMSAFCTPIFTSFV